jgi:flap endonuclease-1
MSSYEHNIKKIDNYMTVIRMDITKKKNMGFKYLNSYLRDNCTTNSMSKTYLKICSGKTIVIDTSIYLYKFKGENALLKNMFQMISLFKKYNITPIFIFDGKPPIEKQELILQRYQEKKDARETYWKMKTEFDINGTILTNNDIQTMKKLKKQSLRITQHDIISVKELMNAYAVTFYDAPNESDQLCAYLVNSGQAWACLSDDMDMFVYGCSRVIRHINLLHESILFYDMSKILGELQLTISEFRQIIVLSGTDYSHKCQDFILPKQAYQLFYEYQHKKCGNESFLEWLAKIKKIQNLIEIQNISDMFDISRQYDMLGNEIESQKYTTNRPICWNKIKKIMGSEGICV